MPTLVHITDEKNGARIKRSGIALGKERRVIFFMPVVQEGARRQPANSRTHADERRRSARGRSNMNQPWSVALCLGLLTFATQVIGQDGEFWTLACLVGYENDDSPQICAEVAPETKNDVAEAHRKWLIRNANALRELQDACRDRLLRAYGDEKSIREAKEQAALWVVRYRRPFAKQIVDCWAYAKDFAEGGPQIDIPQEILKATRNTQASKVQWVNGIPQVGTPAHPR